MKACPEMVVAALVAFLVASLPAAWPSSSSSSSALEDCRWLSSGDIGGGGGGGGGLECRLRTLHGHISSANLSSSSQYQYSGMALSERLFSLRLECNDQLFFESFLEAHTFRDLVHLRDLDLEFCKIARLPSQSFHSLAALKNLAIRTHNTDWPAIALEAAPGAFDHLQSLERLDLSFNNIWTLPEDVFCPMRNLRYINLTQNRLQDIEMLGFSRGMVGMSSDWRWASSGGSGCGANLRVLDIGHNSMETIPPESLATLGRLEELYLESNVISSLPDRALVGLESLRIVNLSGNKLVNLPPELFEATRGMKEIHLQNNSLAVLAPGLFEGLDQLLVLDLSFNDLTSDWVNSETFNGLLRLVVLNLSHNRLSRLDSAIFRTLYSLQILRLNHNEISSISENSFASMTNLHTLILSHNQLLTLDASTLNGLQVLSQLSVDNNAIETVHPSAFRNCSNLQDLNLSGNNLFHVPVALQELQLLKTLDLGENHISNVENVSFSHMQHLYGLRLIDNRIGNVSRSTFTSLQSLRILNLAKNQIYGVEPGTFHSNMDLRAVRLDSNYLSDIGGLFINLPSLIWLNLSANQLVTFDYSMIPTRLQWLDLHANKIRELGNSMELEGQLYLRTFDVSFNRLTEVSSSVIPDSVEHLFLNENRINTVQPYAFFKKPNLTRVDLFGNQIARLDQNALRISPGAKGFPLPEFYIGGNPFQCDCSMEWLQRINTPDSLRQHPRVMDLESIYCKLLYNRDNTYVPLVEAQTSQFLCEYSSHCFALCHCCDFDACDCEMTCPTNCTCYHDQSWSANIVDCSEVGHFHLPERIPMDSTELYLDGNDIRSLSSHIFIGRKNLRVLFLNNSNLDVLHNRTFNGLRAMEVLHLQDNRIAELRGYEFDGLPNLRILDLHNNRLTTIHNATFLTLHSLQTLLLDGNRLLRLAVWQLSHNPNLKTLSLAHNPWTCECDFVNDFRVWASEAVSVLADSESIHCVLNETTEGPLLVETNSTWCAGNNTESRTIIRQLMMHDYLPLLVATLAVFLVVTAVSLVLFCYRHSMRVWLHSRFGVRLGAKREFEGEREKLFDAFVSYSSKDEVFVTQVLAPRLEQGPPSYRLCLHHRDFPVGAYLTDTIVQAVDASRRTIMVLSENFIKSEWCRFEFKSAHHQVLKDRRKRLIMILLGEVPHKDLDPDIRLYLKTNTYLQWGDKRFWEKLRFAMPDAKVARTVVRSTHNNANSSPRAVAIHI